MKNFKKKDLLHLIAYMELTTLTTNRKYDEFIKFGNKIFGVLGFSDVIDAARVVAEERAGKSDTVDVETRTHLSDIGMAHLLAGLVSHVRNSDHSIYNVRTDRVVIGNGKMLAQVLVFSDEATIVYADGGSGRYSHRELENLEIYEKITKP